MYQNVRSTLRFNLARFVEEESKTNRNDMLLRTRLLMSPLRRFASSKVGSISASGESWAAERQMPYALKEEMHAKRLYNDHPFENYTVKPDTAQGSSPHAPILVPTTQDSRIVGCCCENDYREVVWFELKKTEEAQRCDCGIYFKLIAHDPLDANIKPKFGSGFGSGLSTYHF